MVCRKTSPMQKMFRCLTKVEKYWANKMAVAAARQEEIEIKSHVDTKH